MASQVIPSTLKTVNSDALTAALKAALPGKIDGISTYGPARPITIWMGDNAVDADGPVALGVYTAHDAVTLSADKLSILANGIDAATITVTAQPGGAPCTLVITQPGGAQVTQAVTMNAGFGTIAFTTVVPGVYTFALQNPANRTTDMLTVTAS